MADEGKVQAVFAEKNMVVLDKSPFYGESGGQVGDKGALIAGGNEHQVLDTHKQEGLVLHRVKLRGPVTSRARARPARPSRR